MTFRIKGHAGYWAFVVHRVSGIALALFLPLHFWVLSRALNGAARLDAFLDWTRHPLVQATEWGMVLALAAHLAGGLRILALELLPWRGWQKSLAAIAAGFVVGVALALSL